MVRALMGNHTVRSLVLPILCAGFALSACGDDGMSTPDAGMEADTGTTPIPDGGVADSGERPDFGMRPDTGVVNRDGGHFCVSGNSVDVENVSVNLSDTVSDTPQNPSGSASSLECIQERPTQMLFGSIRYSGCLEFFGTPPALADVQSQLEFTIFQAYVDAGGGNIEPNDPSFVAGTGTVAINRGTPVNADVEVSTVPVAECPSGLQIEIAKNGDTLRSDLEYILRVRPIGAGAGTWVTTYMQGVIVRSEFVSGGSIAFCTPQNCYGLIDVPLVRASELGSMLSAAGVSPAGSGDLTDYDGAGYAFVHALDCQDQSVVNAVAGFDTAPQASAYLDTDGTFLSSNATGMLGLYAGFGFTTTSSNTATKRWAAMGLSRDGTCTESFSGRSFDVYADSLTIIRLGQENTIHAQ